MRPISSDVIERYRSYALDVLMRLIEVPTISTPGDKYVDFVNLLEKIFGELAVDLKVIEVPRSVLNKHIPEHADHPRYIVYVRYGRGRDVVVHFNGHYDVVQPGAGWTVTDPFRPKYVNGRVYGRGSCDMKAGLTSIILLLRALSDLRVELSGTVEASFVPDEEIGGFTGTGYLVDVIERPNYVIVAEPSGINNIWIGNKGILWVLVEVFGRQAHASKPWLGVNAFEAGVKLACHLIEVLRHKVESKMSRYEYEDPEGKRATIAFGGDVRSVGKINVVPGYFAFSVDRRVLPDESLDEAEREIVETVGDLARKLGVSASCRVIQRSPGVVTDPNSRLVKTLKECIRNVLGVNAREVVCTGGLDTRFFQERGVEAVTYGPGDPNVPHTVDEYVELEDVIKVTNVYLQLITKLVGGS